MSVSDSDQIRPPKRIGLVLVPQFSMLAFSAAIEPLRVANRFAATPAYEWRLYSSDGEPVMSSSGIVVMVDRAASCADPWSQLLFVLAGFEPWRWAAPKLQVWLKAQSRRGVAMGAISNGAYVLAAAGLLQHYRCTTHWENLQGFREQYPELQVSDRIFEVDRNRYTCSGGTAALDLMLHIIAQDYGQPLALTVSEQFIHERLRATDELQRMAGYRALEKLSPKLAAAIRLMQANIEKPLPITEVARQVGLSLRQLERLCVQHQQCPPQRYYLKLRLEQAKRLLDQTGLSILNVALATGFVSQSHFTKCYRDYFGITPYRERSRMHTKSL